MRGKLPGLKRINMKAGDDMGMASAEFRYAVKSDVPLILKFIRELADYEKMLSEVVATEALLEEWLFEK